MTRRGRLLIYGLRGPPSSSACMLAAAGAAPAPRLLQALTPRSLGGVDGAGVRPLLLPGTLRLQHSRHVETATALPLPPPLAPQAQEGQEAAATATATGSTIAQLLLPLLCRLQGCGGLSGVCLQPSKGPSSAGTCRVLCGQRLLVSQVRQQEVGGCWHAHAASPVLVRLLLTAGPWAITAACPRHAQPGVPSAHALTAHRPLARTPQQLSVALVLRLLLQREPPLHMRHEGQHGLEAESRLIQHRLSLCPTTHLIPAPSHLLDTPRLCPFYVLVARRLIRHGLEASGVQDQLHILIPHRDGARHA